jgi:hypothetical protein
VNAIDSIVFPQKGSEMEKCSIACSDATQATPPSPMENQKFLFKEKKVKETKSTHFRTVDAHHELNIFYLNPRKSI